ncbi:GntR family transcriptional regulator [Microbacterium sp. ARD31]|uniref:GntR family transcriptional regulator n=1 Tax=Microbacterium sp. ARD31 TaxID=2962576 RepID=UPI00288259A1|nr:GntR family transcriptional regulator [Microbacterium sp. ARD31]MDT0181792.1 GntR family transcriptional regulator [Microbacterium sp. ARD31]
MITPRLVVDDVYDALVSLIVDGHVPPEGALSIDALSRELGVSTSPVREALTRLEGTGLIRRMALRGWRVAPALTREELADLVDARLLIEPGAAALAAGRADALLVRSLDESVSELGTAPKGARYESFRDYYEADRRFHRTIVAAGGNPFIEQAYEALGGQYQRFRLFTGTGVTDAAPTMAEHGAVRDAIAAGDADGAAEAMRAHLRGVRERALAELADR